MAFQNTAVQNAALQIGAIAGVVTFSYATVTTDRVSCRTLYYQAKIEPPPQPAPAVAQATIDWLQPLSRAAPTTKPRLSNLTHALAPISQPYAAFDVQTAYLSVKVLHYQDFFETIAVAVENTVTPDKWLQPLGKAAQSARPAHTQPILGYQPVAVQNLTTTLEWMQAFQGPPRYRPVPTQIVYPVQQQAVVSNLTTSLEWMPAWQGPPRYWPTKVQTPPFVQRFDNTISGIAWLQSFRGAPPIRPIHTQPFFGYPYVPIQNLTTTLEWMQAWKGPPRYRPAKTQVTYQVEPISAPANYAVFDIQTEYLARRALHYQDYIQALYPPVVVPNATTTLEWMQAFRGPPRYRPGKILAQPFVPREAVIDNTITGNGWLFRFQKAVPPRPVRRTQPFYGYPYGQTDTCVGAFDLAFQVDAFQTCVQQIRGWFMPLSQPVPPRPVRRTQPFYGFPYAYGPPNVITTLDFVEAWQGPPRIWPVPTQPAWDPQFVVQLAVIVPVCAHTEIVFPTAVVDVVFHTTDTEVLFPTSETEPEECPD